MNKTPNQAIAERLLQARARHQPWQVNLPAPPTRDDAYAVQDLVLAELDPGIAGWKTSAPDRESIPIAAPIYTPLLYPGGASIPAGNFFVIGIEGEIAFRIARDLPAAGKAYTRDDLIAAVVELVPAIEIVDTRMQDGMSQANNLKLADNQSNGGLVVGKGITDWQELDFDNIAASVTVNGACIYDGIDANRAGDLFTLMAWAANHCAVRGRPYLRDDIITTGTYTGIAFIEPGDEVVVDFPLIGSVAVSFTT